MEFKKLTDKDTKSFALLIKNMYSHLQNLEWFSPMPYDEENVKGILTSDRFFILGAFENGKLCAVSSFDFKCGKLIGTSNLPSYCTLDNTAEIGFTMVKSSWQGQGIMKKLIEQLEKCALKFNKKYLFGKVHVDNLASYKSFKKCGFNELLRYDKVVKRSDFENFLTSNLLSQNCLSKARESLKSNTGDIVVKYAILIKTL